MSLYFQSRNCVQQQQQHEDEAAAWMAIELENETKLALVEISGINFNFQQIVWHIMFLVSKQRDLVKGGGGVSLL